MTTVLFGAGQNGYDFVITYKDILNKSSLLFCDNDMAKWGGNLENISIISFPEMLELYRRHEVNRIIITSCKLMEIATLCIQNKIAYQELFYFNIATKSILPFVGLYSDLTVSQDGEEVYLKSKFANREKGLYVDIGANHPIRFSNTWWAYIKGWRGINIEPNVNNFKLLESIRNEDININCGIANEEGYLDYYEFQESALNTFVYEEIEEKIKNQIINIHKVPVRQLSDILKENNVHQIDYIDIDVEGMEMEVLQSINWDDVSIEVLLIEQRRMSLENVIKSDICKFLYNKGYIPQNKYNRTVIYEKSM